jgi:hypothetical protein
MTVENILNERNKTHGDFEQNAKISQELKMVIEQGLTYNKLTSVEAEALSMICHKVGRILSGNPHYQDHWDDISGYATLVSKQIKSRSQK